MLKSLSETSSELSQKLISSEAQFKSLSEASPLGVFSTDTEGACTFTNARWQAIFGLSQDDAIGQGWSQTLHPDDKLAVHEEWQRTAASGADFDMEFRICRQDGAVIHVRALSRPVLDARRKVTAHVGSVEDVTEKLQALHELREERLRLKLILKGTDAATWEWDIVSGKMRFNERWADMLGMQLHQLKDTTIDAWIERTHPDDLAQSTALLKQHFNGDLETFECEIRMRHRAGHWVWMLGRGRVLTRTGDGRPKDMYGTLQDISSRKQHEQRIQRSEQLLKDTGELADVGGWGLHLATQTLTWSEQTFQIHGLESDYPLDLDTAIEFYAPEARPVIRSAIDRAMRDGQAWDLELPLIRADGQRIWVHAVGHAEFENGQPVRLLGAVQNITRNVLQRQALENAHERITLATDSGNIGIWDWDIQNDKLNWTPLMFPLYGLPETTAEMQYETWRNCLHPDDREAAELALQGAIASRQDLDGEFRIVTPAGGIRHLRFAARVSTDDHGTAVRMVGVNWDVTSLRQLSCELAEQHELLQVTLHSIGDAVITTDETGLVTWLNPAATKMTGWLADDAFGRHVSQVFHIVNEQTRELAESPVTRCLKQHDIVGLAHHTVLISRDGTEFGIEDSAAPIRAAGGQTLGVVLVFHDVTEKRRLASVMSYRAAHDALTGLCNRSEFEARLRHTLNKAHETDSKNALMYMDLDQFKLVNDACGHSVGDKLLQQISKLLVKSVRGGDTLARLGGDEFALILEDCTSAQAQRVAQQICDRMEEFRFVHDERRFRIGASIGLVPLDSRWVDTAGAMQAADVSCYAAKEAGRNRVHVWFDTDQAMLARHDDTQWATRLEQALDDDLFVLHAQRIETVPEPCSGLHAEALIRLRASDEDLILPGVFMPAAERFHLATRIDRWVLRHAIEMLAELPDLSTVATLCINLSGQSIGDRVFHRDALAMLAEAGHDICHRICLEITETVAVTNMTDAALFIEKVHALGLRMALDDFGAGASSFGYLKNLSVDVLKIDGQFIQDLIDDPLDAAAVRCFVDVAGVLGLKTVAEFIDRPEVHQRVREMGIDYAQGNLLHEPEPMEQLLGLTSTRRAVATTPA